MAQHERPWKKIFSDHCGGYDFDVAPFVLTADMIKESTRRYSKTTDKEVRTLTKMDTREELPSVLSDRGLFILPVKNGIYNIIKGEGFHDIEPEPATVEEFSSRLKFKLKSANVGDSEMQHLDFAFNSGLVEYFVGGPKQRLFLQIRGRKYSPAFKFKVGDFLIDTESVQTEVDAGFEGRKVVVLIEAKSANPKNFIIRQLYYPYRQWKIHTAKEVVPLFFIHDHKNDEYKIWQYKFCGLTNYNGIRLVKRGKFKIVYK